MPARPLQPRDWARIIRPGSRVFLGSGAAVPLALTESLLEQARDLRDVELVHIHTLGDTPWIRAEFASSLRTNSFFLTAPLREAIDAGRADYTPCPLSDVPRLFETQLPVDVALIQVSPPDRRGMCSLGVSVDVTRAALRAARHVVAQVNPLMPRTHGDTAIALRSIGWVLEAERPLPELTVAEPDARQRRIAEYVAQLIDDGATLQAGLGATPQACLAALRGRRRLGIHTGMLGDGLRALIECGAVDNSRKGLHAGRSVVSHALGSSALYAFVNGNRTVDFQPTEWVNDPFVIAQNRNMAAINGAREVDLTGQVVRDSAGHHFDGGIGALQDFVRGAARSPGGRPVIVLTSTHDDAHRSRIVADLEPGSGVATSRGDVHYVVTEYGIARLHGRSIRERVTALVEIAHPDFREDLLRGARERGWVPPFFTLPPTTPGDLPGGLESRHVTLRGARYLLRPLHPSDLRALQEFFYSHSEDTVRLRYGYLRRDMGQESAYKLLAIDQSRDLALALFHEEGERQEIRAVGRFFIEDNGRLAEVAFVVHEEERRRGMARFLLLELARVARTRGIRQFWASVLRQNTAMASLFLKLGGVRTESGTGDSDTFRLEVEALAATPAARPRTRKT
jgi:acyl-CoA hydrolase/GNAT superfamily N-acetyltransferase